MKDASVNFSVLFVCMGNICRSPTAHGVFKRKLMDCLNRLGYDIEIKVPPVTELVGHLTLAAV